VLAMRLLCRIQEISSQWYTCDPVYSDVNQDLSKDTKMQGGMILPLYIEYPSLLYNESI